MNTTCHINGLSKAWGEKFSNIAGIIRSHYGLRSHNALLNFDMIPRILIMNIACNSCPQWQANKQKRELLQIEDVDHPSPLIPIVQYVTVKTLNICIFLYQLHLYFFYRPFTFLTCLISIKSPRRNDTSMAYIAYDQIILDGSLTSYFL